MPDGVEIVVCDNSDQPELLSEQINELFEGSIPNWLNFTFKPAQESVRSMRQNWQKALDQASGEWITFIGDDDYADPLISNLLFRLRDHDKDYDYLGWGHLKFQWPGVSDNEVTVRVNLSNKLKRFPIETAFDDLLACKGDRPTSLLSPYHGAIHRSLIERVSSDFGNDSQFFKHSNVDYFSGWLAATRSKKNAFSLRQLSVAGASVGSNSYLTRKGGGSIEASKIAIKEQSNDHQGGENAGILDSIKDRGDISSLSEFFYLLPLDFFKLVTDRNEYEGNWVENTIQRFETELLGIVEKETFQITKEHMDQFLNKTFGIKTQTQWSGPTPEMSLARGFHNGHLFILNSAFGCNDSAEFYSHINQLLRPIQHLGNEVKLQTRGAQ